MPHKITQFQIVVGLRYIDNRFATVESLVELVTISEYGGGLGGRSWADTPLFGDCPVGTVTLSGKPLGLSVAEGIEDPG
jgi:hypothetical protein